jgi:hypothetical protein
MRNDLIAKATTSIRASSAVVWDALVNPESIKKVYVRHHRQHELARRKPDLLERRMEGQVV